MTMEYKKAADLFSRLIGSEKTVHVKLLGDSITHGVGGTGFQQNGEPITEGYARNPDGFCWARLLREELESRYNCTVTNNACTGTRIEFILDRFDELVSPDDDLVLCTIGTNNRHQYCNEQPRCTAEEYKDRFYANILKLNERFRQAGITPVFVANIPAAPSNEQDGPDYVRLFHMWDVADLYRKAQTECGFALIDLYQAFLDDCDARNVPFTSLLADGLHPNDEGYRVIYRLLMRELGLHRSI